MPYWPNARRPPILAIVRGFMPDHMAHRDALDGAIDGATGAAGKTPSGSTATVTYPRLKSRALTGVAHAHAGVQLVA